MRKLLLLGCGNMGSALLAQWAKQETYAITVVVTQPKDLPDGVSLHIAGEDLAGECFDVMVAAVKPQMMEVVLPQYSGALAEGGMLLSLAAGMPLASLQSYFAGSAVVRAMPNMAAMVGQSMSGLVANEQATAAHREEAEVLLAQAGDVLWLADEDQIDRFTAVAGSGPGYIFHVMEAFMAGAQALGFSDEEARKMVLRTFSGSCEAALQSDQSLATLRESVTSKAGTTEAGLQQLMADEGLEELFVKTTQAAYARAVALRGGLGK